MGARSICSVTGQFHVLLSSTFYKAPLYHCSALSTTAFSPAPHLKQSARHLSTAHIHRQNDDGKPQESVRIDAEDPDRLLKLQEREEQEYEHTIKQKILRASLNHVQEFGWTTQAFEAGAASEGLPSVSHGMFPKGGVELINFFYSEKNKELGEILAQQVEKCKQEGLEKPNTRKFIKDSIEIRLKMILPFFDKWPQAMAIQTLPQNAPTAWSNLLNVADEIWYHAGDRSTDFNWYTKRLSVAGVYKASEIFMLQDNSIDQQDTWDFVDRRLDEVVALGSTKQSLDKTCGSLKESLKGFAIMSRNMMGMNSRGR